MEKVIPGDTVVKLWSKCSVSDLATFVILRTCVQAQSLLKIWCQVKLWSPSIRRKLMRVDKHSSGKCGIEILTEVNTSRSVCMCVCVCETMTTGPDDLFQPASITSTS